jgi:hypothetical protein
MMRPKHGVQIKRELVKVGNMCALLGLLGLLGLCVKGLLIRGVLTFANGYVLNISTPV